MSPTACLTCIKSIESDELSVKINENRNAQAALSKHFWFAEDQCLDSSICQACWLKIDEFSRFYCEVEQLHAQQTYPPIQLLEIKEEFSIPQLTPELEDPVMPDCDENRNETISEKIADGQNDGDANRSDLEDEEDDDKECDGGNEEDDYKSDKVSAESSSSDDSTNDFDFKPKRQKLKKSSDMEKIGEFIRANIELKCAVCSERSETFEDLQSHSSTQHDTLAHVICCKRRYNNIYRLHSHVQFHLDPESLKCSHCSKQCWDKDALRKHTKKVHTPDEEKKHHCSVCRKLYTTRSAVILHEKQHAKTDSNDGGKQRKRPHENRAKRLVDNERMISEHINLECDSCHKRFDTFVSLQKHSMAEHKKLSYVLCCGLKFNKKPRLIDHVLFHLDPTSFQCKICLKNLPHTESLRRHMDSNHTPVEAKTLKCSMCPKMFSHQRFLNTHERYHNRSWLCEICNKRFICEAILKQHHRSVHTKELNYVCHVCAKTFHIYSSYRSHLQTHDTVKRVKLRKPVPCPVCGTMTPKLSHHIRLHSGTKTCEICGQVCKNVISYQYHMKQHETGDLFCSVCGKGFKREITLKEHMASHTGEVLYSCDFCDRTFNSNANRAAHRKKMHPQQWLEDKMRKKAARQQALLGETPQID